MTTRRKPRLFSFPREVELAHLDAIVEDVPSRALITTVVDDFIDVVRTRALDAEQLVRVRDAAAHPNPAVRAFAITRLSVLAHYFEPAIDALLGLLHHDDPEVRLYATSALANLPDDALLDLLPVALKDPDWRVRKAAAQASGTMRDPRLAELLAAALDDEKDARVRVVLQGSLSFQRAF